MGDLDNLDDEYEKSRMDNDNEEVWEDDEDVSENLEDISFVCEDCDYRWEETGPEEADESNVVCPMCGSTNVTLL